MSAILLIAIAAGVAIFLGAFFLGMAVGSRRAGRRQVKDLPAKPWRKKRRKRRTGMIIAVVLGVIVAVAVIAIFFFVGARPKIEKRSYPKTENREAPRPSKSYKKTEKKEAYKDKEKDGEKR